MLAGPRSRTTASGSTRPTWSGCCSGNRDGRDFIATTFDGLYFRAAGPRVPRRRLVADRRAGGRRSGRWRSARCVWPRPGSSRAGSSPSPRRATTTGAASCACAAGPVPGGRRASTRRSSRGPAGRALCGDVFAIDPEPYALAYLDPPYAPPRDDTGYIKRYHFLEGLATYWRGRRSCGRRARASSPSATPRSRTSAPRPALDRTFDHFWRCALVVSYGRTRRSQSRTSSHAPAPQRSARRMEIDHRYGFGTHVAAKRRVATEYVLVADVTSAGIPCFQDYLASLTRSRPRHQGSAPETLELCGRATAHMITSAATDPGQAGRDHPRPNPMPFPVLAAAANLSRERLRDLVEGEFRYRRLDQLARTRRRPIAAFDDSFGLVAFSRSGCARVDMGRCRWHGR